MTLSPGLQAVIIATIIASVLPQVTTRCWSGSTSSPVLRLILRARAWRKRGAPQVTAYWWCGPRVAVSRAERISSGGSKSGKPWERFMAPQLLARRVMLRMTDSENWARRLAGEGMGGVGCWVSGVGCWVGRSSVGFALSALKGKRPATERSLCFCFFVLFIDDGHWDLKVFVRCIVIVDTGCGAGADDAQVLPLAVGASVGVERDSLVDLVAAELCLVVSREAGG